MFDLSVLFSWIVFDSLYSCSQVLPVFGLILSLKDRSHRAKAKVLLYLPLAHRKVMSYTCFSVKGGCLYRVWSLWKGQSPWKRGSLWKGPCVEGSLWKGVSVKVVVGGGGVSVKGVSVRPCFCEIPWTEIPLVLTSYYWHSYWNSILLLCCLPTLQRKLWQVVPNWSF